MALFRQSVGSDPYKPLMHVQGLFERFLVETQLWEAPLLLCWLLKLSSCLFMSFDNPWKASKRNPTSALDEKYPKSLLALHHKVWDVYCRIGLSLPGNKSALSNQNRQTHGTEKSGTIILFMLCWYITV